MRIPFSLWYHIFFLSAVGVVCYNCWMSTAAFRIQSLIESRSLCWRAQCTQIHRCVCCMYRTQLIDSLQSSEWFRVLIWHHMESLIVLVRQKNCFFPSFHGRCSVAVATVSLFENKYSNCRQFFHSRMQTKRSQFNSIYWCVKREKEKKREKRNGWSGGCIAAHKYDPVGRRYMLPSLNVQPQ